MKISVSCALEPRRYTADSTGSRERKSASRGFLIEICEDGLDLDLAGAVLDGEDRTGSGIYVHDCERVTIKNGIIKGFYHGVRAEHVRGLRIANCVVSDNHNPTHQDWLSDTVNPSEAGFGGGIYFRDVQDSSVEACDLSNNFDGLHLVRSDRNIIRGNDASYSSNIGIHLLQSSHNTIEGNRAVHCIRYTGRFWCDAADSAGILLEEYSHHNRIIDNTLRYSGDGFFIRANNRHSCNHNYIARNDASFSPNNAFEAVFSEHNTFENNVADFSNYGFWLGYSRHTVVRGNRIRRSRIDGIAVEHCSHNIIEENEIDGSRYGIRLWQESRKTSGMNDPSEDYTIRGNVIRNARECGVLYSDTRDVRVEANVYDSNKEDTIDAG